MSQKRIQDYGTPIVAKSLKTISSSLVQAAVLSGNEFVVDSSDRLKVGPGRAITNQGVIIIEDESKILTVPNTASAVDYTVYYSHVDQDISGGVSASLVIEPGIFTAEVIDGVILGYVRYPGSGVPLSGSMFIQPPQAKIGNITPTRGNSDFIVPINQMSYMVTSQSGGPLDITSTWDTSVVSSPQMYLKIRNNGLSTGSVTLTFPFKVKDNPFALLQGIFFADINAIISAFFVDSAGSTSALMLTPITGAPSLNFYYYDVPRTSVQNTNSLVYLQIVVQCSASREARIQAVGLNEYNLPV